MPLNKRTVLVLGAGASMPYGFPSGHRLKELIIRGLKGYPDKIPPNSQLGHLFSQSGSAPDKVIAFRDTLRHADNVTIDLFLQNRPEFMDVGKLAIAGVLIPYEADSLKLMFDSGEPARAEVVDRRWYRYFATQLRLSYGYWGNGLLTIITFNYDRSLDHYLFEILRSTSTKTNEELWRRYQEIPIIHVFGELGPYEPYGNGLPFGVELTTAAAKKASESIRIIHEGADEARLKAIRATIEQAEMVCFLGVGYHPENMAIFNLEKRSGDSTLNSIACVFELTDIEKAGLN